MSPAAGQLTGSPGLAELVAGLERSEGRGDLTHGLHPYPAKFVPRIPQELIRAHSRPGDLVWDPMCGSGTTLVEAALAGRDAIGTDINPIALLASRAKTTPLSRGARDELRGLLLRLRVQSGLWPSGRPDEDPQPPDFRNREHWFETSVTRELGLIADEIDRVRSGSARELARCAFSAILVGVSNQEGETSWRARPQELEPGAVRGRFTAKLAASLTAVERYAEVAIGTVEVDRCDAREAGDLDRAVDLVVTSPPYANTHDYYLYNKLRMFWLGEPVRPVQAAEIGSRNAHSDRGEGIETYLEAMQLALRGMARALKPRGRVAMVVADGVIRGELYPMDELIPEIAAPAGFELEDSARFDHRRFNATHRYAFTGERSRKATHVLVMQLR